MNLTTLNNHYLIKPDMTDQEKNLKKLNVEIPDSVKRSGNIGIIKQTHFEEHPLLRSGMRVIFKPYGNQEVVLEGEDYLFVPLENIICVFTEEKEEKKKKK